MQEILMFIGINKSKKEVIFLDERVKNRITKYKNKDDLEKKIIRFVKTNLKRNEEELK